MEENLPEGLFPPLELFTTGILLETVPPVCSSSCLLNLNISSSYLKRSKHDVIRQNESTRIDKNLIQ